ncbi:MAG TPA: hypothetical protein VMC10_00260 [Stellaceae bacterium]|nr:hypothetical protein [Stellaceae bacterium]
MSKMVAVDSPIMASHLIDVEIITGADWDAPCRPAVRLDFSDGSWDIVTRDSADMLASMGAIAGPAHVRRP